MAYIHSKEQLRLTAAHVASSCRVDLSPSEQLFLRQVAACADIAPDWAHKAWKLITVFTPYCSNYRSDTNTIWISGSDFAVWRG